MTEMTKSMAVFTGSVNPSLADQVATELGTTLGNVKLEKFANGEIYARYLDSVRGADVFIIQSIAGEHINDALMEMLIMIDAAKRASARTISAVVTHYGYSRQERNPGFLRHSGEPYDRHADFRGLFQEQGHRSRRNVRRVSRCGSRESR